MRIETVDVFIPLLETTIATKRYVARIEPPGPLHKKIVVIGRSAPFELDPLTAVYHHLSGKAVRGSFLHREIQEAFGMPWYVVQPIVYAISAIDIAGVSYDRRLRNRILKAVRLPEEIIPQHR